MFTHFYILCIILPCILWHSSSLRNRECECTRHLDWSVSGSMTSRFKFRTGSIRSHVSFDGATDDVSSFESIDTGAIRHGELDATFDGLFRSIGGITVSGKRPRYFGELCYSRRFSEAPREETRKRHKRVTPLWNKIQEKLRQTGSLSINRCSFDSSFLSGRASFAVIE